MARLAFQISNADPLGPSNSCDTKLFRVAFSSNLVTCDSLKETDISVSTYWTTHNIYWQYTHLTIGGTKTGPSACHRPIFTHFYSKYSANLGLQACSLDPFCDLNWLGYIDPNKSCYDCLRSFWSICCNLKYSICYKNGLICKKLHGVSRADVISVENTLILARNSIHLIIIQSVLFPPLLTELLLSVESRAHKQTGC